MAHRYPRSKYIKGAGHYLFQTIILDIQVPYLDLFLSLLDLVNYHDLLSEQ